jgi:alanyl-tRNA synthetase
LADKVVQLRASYEKKANDVLSANDKPIKEKMDALSADVAGRNQKEMADTVPLYDTKDNTQMFTMIRALREKISKNIQDGEDQLTLLLPADTKTKLVDALKAQAAARERQAQFMNFIGNGGPGGPGGQGGGARGRGQGGPGGGANDTVKPPRPPETEKF